MGLRTPVLLFYGVRKNGRLDNFTPLSRGLMRNLEYITKSY